MCVNSSGSHCDGEILVENAMIPSDKIREAVVMSVQNFLNTCVFLDLNYFGDIGPTVLFTNFSFEVGRRPLSYR